MYQSGVGIIIYYILPFVCFCLVSVLVYTPFKISNATRIWLIIFLLSWICIHQVRYAWKVCLFAFWLMPYLLGLFYWGACRVSKLGETSKRKGCKIDRIEWEMRVISSFWPGFWLSFVSVRTSTHCPVIAPQSSQSFGGFSAMNGQWLPRHTVTKGKPQTWYNTHFPFNPINFATFFVDGSPNLLNLHAPPVKQS